MGIRNVKHKACVINWWNGPGIHGNLPARKNGQKMHHGECRNSGIRELFNQCMGPQSQDFVEVLYSTLTKQLFHFQSQIIKESKEILLL